MVKPMAETPTSNQTVTQNENGTTAITTEITTPVKADTPTPTMKVLTIYDILKDPFLTLLLLPFLPLFLLGPLLAGGLPNFQNSQSNIPTKRLSVYTVSYDANGRIQSITQMDTIS
jgi:hypothetical protein